MKPLLAATLADLSTAVLPVLASPKLDGIRCLILNGQAVSRTLKPIPNDHVREALAGLPELDGELIVGSPTAPDCFSRTSSAVMSKAGLPDFTFHVFDRHDMPGDGFSKRLASIAGFQHPRVHVVNHAWIGSETALVDYEASAVLQGYEGIMVRSPFGPYKFGRSTLLEGTLLKVKRFADTEATVIGCEELMHNENDAGTDALGHTERSSAKAGLRPGGTLGALVCRAAEWSNDFRIGAGFTAAQRAEIWEMRHRMAGRLVRFKHQPHGAKDAPRLPIFQGFRSTFDIG